MEKKLAKDRKYYLADMHRSKKHLDVANDTLDSYIASIDYGRVLVERKDSSSNSKCHRMKRSLVDMPTHSLPDTSSPQKKYLKWAIDKYSVREPSTQTTLFQEFMALVRDSEDYLEFYGKKFSEELIDLISSVKGKKCVLLCILKDRYGFFKHKSGELVNRVILSLSVNPLNDFSPIDWNKFTLLRRMMTTKDFEMLSCVKFMLSLFFQGHNEEITKQSFEQILRVLCASIDNRLIKANQQAVSKQIMQDADNLQLFGSAGFVSKNFLREVFLKQSLVSLSDFMALIFREY